MIETGAVEIRVKYVKYAKIRYLRLLFQIPQAFFDVDFHFPRNPNRDFFVMDAQVRVPALLFFFFLF